MRRSAMLVVVGLTLVAGSLAGCGDDEDPSDVAADVKRYCELVAELDEAGSEAFEALEADETATDDDYARTERQFIEEHEDDFDELRDVAPKEIADDVDALLTAQEARASGGEQEEPLDDVEAAEKRIEKFENKNCDARN